MTAHNSVTLMGRLTRDVETKFLPDGKAIASFSLAVDGYKKDAPPNFIDCTAFGKTAELIGQYFAKGKPILINGSLRQDTWEDKTTGAKRSKINVSVDGFSFIPRSSEDAGTPSAPSVDPVVRRDGRDQAGNAKPEQAAAPAQTPLYDDDSGPPF